MKATLISTFDRRGGAARAFARLQRGFQRIGFPTASLVLKKSSHDPSITAVTPLMDLAGEKRLNTCRTITNEYLIQNKTANSTGRFSLGYPGYNLTETPEIKEADIIHLHWLNGFQSVETTAALLEMGKKVYWTFHDEYPLTGGCHYSGDCLLYRGHCSPCPHLREDPFELARRQLELKKRLWGRWGDNITVITPSAWLGDKARTSPIFVHSPIYTIPNGVETDLFYPRDKKDAKRALGLNGQETVVLTAISRPYPRRKGLPELLAILNYCLQSPAFLGKATRGELALLSVDDADPALEQTGIPHLSAGFLDSDEGLARVFSAADFCVLPSREDNLPNIMLEAMACGVPVLAFNAGGMGETIEDGVTGQRVPAYDCRLFADYLCEWTFQCNQTKEMGEQARLRVEREYTVELQAERHRELFIKNGSFKPSMQTPPTGAAPSETERKISLDDAFNPALLPLYQKYEFPFYQKPIPQRQPIPHPKTIRPRRKGFFSRIWNEELSDFSFWLDNY